MPHKKAKRSIRDKQKIEKGTDNAPSTSFTKNTTDLKTTLAAMRTKDSITNTNLKQSVSQEAIPKSLSRVLNSAQIRSDWREKKRKGEDAGGVGEDMGGPKKKKRKVEEKSKLTIQPGESLVHYNRRVEDDMRPLVKTAMSTSQATGRKVRQQEAEEKKAKQLANSQKSKRKTDGDDEEEEEAPSKTDKKGKPEKEYTAPGQREAHRTGPTEFTKHSSAAPRRLNDIAQAPPEFKKLPRGVVAKTAGSANSAGSSVLSMAQKLMMDAERTKAIERYREMKKQRRFHGDDTREREDSGGEE